MELYKIISIDTDEKIIVMKNKIGNNEILTVVLGRNREDARVIIKTDLSEQEILISKKLVDQLGLKACCKYQVKQVGNCLVVGPVIGFLLGEQNYLYANHNLVELTDSLFKYQNTGGLFMAFKANNIDWNEKKVYGLYFDPEKNYWNYGVLPLPQVIFRRAFSSNNKEIIKFFREGIQIFNSRKLDKWQTYLYLKENERINKSLPYTEKLISVDMVNEFISKYRKIVLKPAKLSRGRGICFLELTHDGQILVEDYRGKYPESYLLPEVSNFILNGKLIEQDYIIQEYINLLKFNDVPFDVRVVIQKNVHKDWIITGKECRLPASKGLVTNLARGGRVLKLENIFNKEAEIIDKKINDLAMLIANHMDGLGENFGEFGLDVAIDQKKILWLIEVNFRPTYKGFKLLDLNNYYEIACKPVEYAISLSGFEI